MFWERKKTHQISLLKKNLIDPYACAVQISEIKCTLVPNKTTVGHVPMELSRFIWFFIDLGGNVTGRVIDIKPRRSPIPSAGLEIKLMLTFSGTNQEIMNKMRTFIRCYEYEYTGVRPHQQPADQDSDQESTDDEIEFN